VHSVTFSEHDVVAWSRDQMLHIWTVNHSLRRVQNTVMFHVTSLNLGKWVIISR